MNVANPGLLAEFRTAGICELCGQWCRMRCAAHVLSVGSGRVDHSYNLCATGMDAIQDCACHTKSHYSRYPSTADLWAAVSKREGKPVDFLEATIRAVRACPWQATFEQAERWLLTHFDDKVVAEAAISIIHRVYEV